ncbi:MAG: hypothetical protein IKN71_06540 [Alphaproteobacteria bacterium]|nr:hypothetical protein [Alphaproteobacteria bacterium]
MKFRTEYETRNDVVKKKLKSGDMVYFVPHINQETGLPTQKYDYCSSDDKINRICESFNKGKPRAAQADDIWRVVRAIEQQLKPSFQNTDNHSAHPESKEMAYHKLLNTLQTANPLKTEMALNEFFAKFTRFRGVNLEKEADKFLNLITSEHPELSDNLAKCYLEKAKRMEKEGKTDIRQTIARLSDKVPAFKKSAEMQDFIKDAATERKHQAALFYLLEHHPKVAKSSTDYTTSYIYLAPNASYFMEERFFNEFPNKVIKEAYMSMSSQEKQQIQKELNARFATYERDSAKQR